MRRAFVLALFSALMLRVGIVGAAENPPRNARSSHTITVIDPGLIFPAALRMDRGEPVEFANHSSEMITLMFVEPGDSVDNVRCPLPGNPDAAAGSATRRGQPVFASGPHRHLTVTIPPGRYTTGCWLTPGRYSFVTQQVGRDPRSALDTLGQKGTINVE
jgi:hypothetical protein